MEFSFISNPFATPNFIAALVMFLWIPFVFWIFRTFPARRAIVVAFVVAALYLPEAQLIVPGFPDYTKFSAASYAVLIFTVLFDIQRIKQFKFGFFDVPVLVWCISPFLSSLTNSLGLYDASTSVLTQTMTWGIPFFLGRIYLNDLEGFYQLAVGIFAGGVTYIPLSLFEMRMSPSLHAWIYGGNPHGDFAQTIRMGGYRPQVFTGHGLILSFWMTVSLLVGIWLWRTKVLDKVFGIPLYIIVPVLFVTFALLRSTGAYILFATGLTIIFASVFLRSNVLIYILLLCIFGYLLLKLNGNSDIDDFIIDILSPYLPEDRIASLDFRFTNETALAEKARQRILFGWGGYNRGSIFNADGQSTSVTDSLWIITFSSTGLLGLMSFFSTLLVPIWGVITTKCPCKFWDRRNFASVGVLTLVLLLFSIEALINAPRLPPITLICGALTGYIVQSNPNLGSYSVLASRPLAVK